MLPQLLAVAAYHASEPGFHRSAAEDGVAQLATEERGAAAPLALGQMRLLFHMSGRHRRA